MAKKGQKNKQHPQNITHKLMIEQHQHHENHVILIGTFQRSEDWPSGGEWRVIGAWSAIWVTDDGIMLIQHVPTYVWTRHVVLLGNDHLTCRGGYGFMFRSEKKFRTTRELEYLFFLSRKARNFFPEFNIRFYDKNSESDYFCFSPPKSKYFFQQHWESEYLKKIKNILPSPLSS